MITVSIVSHGHGSLAIEAINDALKSELVSKIVLTINFDEELFLPNDDRLTVIRNLRPLGFSSNHNQAFTLCETEYFCVLNPDVRFEKDTYEKIISVFSSDSIGVVSPTVVGKDGLVEDSARYFPTLASLFRKLILGDKGVYPNSGGIYSEPDWVAGMFMMFRSTIFKEVCGFDNKYFLYYEDVDICKRLKRRKYDILLANNAVVMHSARRDSRKKIKYFILHARSMFRYVVFMNTLWFLSDMYNKYK